MDDATKLVLEETWVATNVDRVMTAHGDIHETVLMAHGYGSDELSARARIAACAPEALRLLMEAEWKAVYQDESTCLHCLRFKHDGHKDDCRWLALMKKCGVR